jgi:hypothetical protein
MTQRRISRAGCHTYDRLYPDSHRGLRDRMDSRRPHRRVADPVARLRRRDRAERPRRGVIADAAPTTSGACTIDECSPPGAWRPRGCKVLSQIFAPSRTDRSRVIRVARHPLPALCRAARTKKSNTASASAASTSPVCCCARKLALKPETRACFGNKVCQWQVARYLDSPNPGVPLCARSF